MFPLGILLSPDVFSTFLGKLYPYKAAQILPLEVYPLRTTLSILVRRCVAFNLKHFEEGVLKVLHQKREPTYTEYLGLYLVTDEYNHIAPTHLPFVFILKADTTGKMKHVAASRGKVLQKTNFKTLYFWVYVQ
jgi:hypothetical protein